MTSIHAVLSDWKHPEHTGENRCLPCTVLNGFIALGLAVAVGALAAIVGVPWTVGIGGLVLGVSAATIYFRGYLVPGTPTLTRRYFPQWLLQWFGKDEQPVGLAADPNVELRALGLVVDGGVDLSLDPAFEAAWQATMDRIETSDLSGSREIEKRLCALGGFELDRLDLVDGVDAYSAWYDDQFIASWESRAACLADVAAADVIPAFDPDWDARSLAVQAELLGALRLFLDRCPVCHSEVTLAHRVVSSCCHDRDVAASVCEGCSARLFEIDLDPEALQAVE